MSTKVLLCLFISIFNISIAHATTYTTNVTGPGNWDTDDDWGGTSPSSMAQGDIVNIGELADITKFGSLSISKEAVFNIEGSLTITGSLSIAKTIVINILPGGSLTVDGATSIAKDANLTIAGGGSTNFNGAVTVAKDATAVINGELNLESTFDATSPFDFTGTGTVNSTSTDVCTSFFSFLTGTCLDPSNNPLPIKLFLFEGAVHENGILLNWQTSSEINNDYIELYRSNDLSNWAMVGELQGQGTTNHKTDYSLLDESPYRGTNYYKLIQYDYDGVSEEFSVISVNFDDLDNLEFGVFPNPSQGSFQITLHQNHNQALYNYTITNAEQGLLDEGMIKSMKEINLDVNRGIYFLKIFSDQNTHIEKIIIK